MTAASHIDLDLQGASSIAVMGIGSGLHSDDAAGLAVIRRIRALMRGSASECSSDCPKIALYECHTAPESFTGPIKALKPSHTVIIDAADLGAVPGTVRTLDSSKMITSSSGTHLLPFSTLAGYLFSETGCKVIVIGIQPADCSFGGRLSKPVRHSVNQLAKKIVAAAGEIRTDGR